MLLTKTGIYIFFYLFHINKIHYVLFIMSYGIILFLLILQVQQIRNTAEEIRNNGTIEANLLTAVAQANYSTVLEIARSEGLKQIFHDLGFTQQEYKNSFNYLRTLRGMPSAHFTIDFQQRIVGNI